MAINQTYARLFKARTRECGDSDMKNIAWIFKKINQEEVSEKELKHLLVSIDEIINEKTMSSFELEAEIQLLQSAKTYFEQQLKNAMRSGLKNDIFKIPAQ